MKNLNLFLIFTFVSLMFSACKPSTKNESDDIMSEDSTAYDSSTEETSDENVLTSANAMLNNASGSTLSGEATFTEFGDNTIEFEITLNHVSPGEHAVHLHQNGDCSAEDATSAGGHWNPTGTEHGKRGEGVYHKGDIANITVADDSTGTLTLSIEGWTIGGPDSTNIINKAVIIHAGADDFTSQPSGAAGARIGCGVISKN